MLRKLTTAATPRLPAAPEEYESRFQNQFSDVLRFYFNQLENVLRALFGSNGAMYIEAPHAMLMSNVDQASGGTTSANLVTYNQSVIAQAIEVRSNSQIWFEHPGQYLVTATIQFTNRGNTAHIVELWAKDNGDNYPLSNTRFDIPARKSESVWSHVTATVSGIFTVDDPTDKFLQMAWWSDGADVFIEHYAAGTTPDRPEIPGVILTVNFVSRLP
jgi:hypothetical protein